MTTGNNLDNVVELDRYRPDFVWGCGHCGGTAFWLVDTGKIECKSCGAKLDGTHNITKGSSCSEPE